MAQAADNRIVVGTMTGTSLDGLDVSIMAIEGQGLTLTARLVHHAATPFGPLAGPLRSLAEQIPASAGAISRLAHDFGALHAEAILATLEQAGLSTQDPTLVALHGQTVFHAPPLSWALLDVTPLMRHLPCTIVSNLRDTDLGAGGQGAPITPLADWILFRTAHPRSIVNLGGFCNVTHLPAADDGPGGITGGDVCACNHLLDAEARENLNAPFDRDGACALAGTIDEGLATELAAMFMRDGTGAEHRSLGTGDEMTEVRARLDRVPDGPGRMATLVDGLARSVAGGIGAVEEALFFGGGCRNKALQARLEHHLPDTRCLFSHPSMPLDARESSAMAVLGVLAHDGEEITIPGVTGRAMQSNHRDGSWCIPAP